VFKDKILLHEQISK